MALLIAAWMLPACSTDETVAPDDTGYPADAPQLPAMSTMAFSLDFFNLEMPQVSQQSIETGKPGPELQTADAANRANFINAFVRALYVHLLMFDALEEPVAAFALAVHSIPQKQDDGSWLWTYIFVENGLEYSIFLYGTPDTGGGYVDWRLEVSTNDPGLDLNHFVWFDGRTHNDDDHGFWQFYDPSLPAPHTAARIDWQNPSATEHRLTVEINGADSDDSGDTLEFFGSSFLATIDHYDAGDDVESNITFNADGSGSLTMPDYNGGETACWDTEQKDTDCPQ
jgi:hypothetical protein